MCLSHITSLFFSVFACILITKPSYLLLYLFVCSLYVSFLILIWTISVVSSNFPFIPQSSEMSLIDFSSLKLNVKWENHKSRVPLYIYLSVLLYLLCGLHNSRHPYLKLFHTCCAYFAAKDLAVCWINIFTAQSVLPINLCIFINWILSFLLHHVLLCYSLFTLPTDWWFWITL
jgi:hypothetical protein